MSFPKLWVAGRSLPVLLGTLQEQGGNVLPGPAPGTVLSGAGLRPLLISPAQTHRALQPDYAMETMHTACPVHMASEEKITELALSAKTHRPRRLKLPEWASCVRQVPGKLSGELVWGCPQIFPLLSAHSPLSPSPQGPGVPETHQKKDCLLWQFPSENKPLHGLPWSWESL